jgi:hypothetical protein
MISRLLGIPLLCGVFGVQDLLGPNLASTTLDLHNIILALSFGDCGSGLTSDNF